MRTTRTGTVSNAKRSPHHEPNAGGHDQRADIHRVAHESIGAGGDDLLAFHFFDGGSAIAVLAKDTQNEHQAERDERVSEHRYPRRDVRPAEAPVEHGENHKQKKNHDAQRDDDLLHEPLLRRRSHLLAAFEQRGVLQREIEAAYKMRDAEDGDERPALPISDRARRNEDEGAGDKKPDDGAPENAHEKLHHARARN